MRHVKLDKIDRRILRDLQADGRMTNVELAHRAGISAPPCLRRVRALEEAGLIRGYHADINAEARHPNLEIRGRRSDHRRLKPPTD
jgi:DNA-binding Lrp family transcriptional regulator